MGLRFRLEVCSVGRCRFLALRKRLLANQDTDLQLRGSMGGKGDWHVSL